MSRSNTLFIDGHKARVTYDPVIDMFRGVFVNTRSEARFMASDVKALKVAARDALDSYLNACSITGVTPFQQRIPLPLVALQRLKAILH
ncbi:type II toxin-antitoxin system HicB family antitoxin [Leclercia adecarboxylata]|uniref:type II toxin-antitoxin system HicB family antitoxin n=1 Tax=Leclercia adecarboxylata TaxID=83655 RepID=UPI002DB8B2FC|nr:type II toxin-antitoxin system HicB family antitoxin [Leclercia adecarboxylata]MEB6380624.1 type II toxin-antitoxin system HicB family antitoxin [Leclercia adecarboxylata]